MKTNNHSASSAIRPRNRRRSRTDLVIPTRLIQPQPEPLAQCEVWGCKNVTTVGPLCLDHWTLKAGMRELQKTVHLASPTKAIIPVKHTLTDGRDN